MRADRLLSILMLLQARGRMSAADLAEALEVSERTIYRDMDALCAAGVPLYAEAGRSGGYALLDEYRTSLTGLKEGELRALFMLSIPEPLAALGIGEELRAALLKLNASLAPARQGLAADAPNRIHLDTVGWERDESVPHLQVIYTAVWEQRRLRIRHLPPFNVEIEQVVEPLGLVAKAGIWYVVYAANQRVDMLRVADLIGAELLAETFTRPPGFNLAAEWQAWVQRRASSAQGYCVRVRVADRLWPYLPLIFGDGVRHRMASAAPPDTEGWRQLELNFSSLDSARSRLIGFGRSLEVLAPLPLRLSLIDHLSQATALYRAGSSGR